MKPVFFVSDLHLGGSHDAERRERFFRFLSRVKTQAGGLYVVGDLLEFGFEYPHGLIEANAVIAAEVARVARAGVPVMLIRGNHDYWLGPRFEAEYGITVRMPPVRTEIAGRKFYISHGDELDRSWENQLSRRLFHSRAATRLYSLLSRRTGAHIAGHVARVTRQADEKPELAVTLERFARQQIQSGFDFVVLGHIHRPALLQFGSGSYLNTGDWLQHFSYGVFDDGKMMLEYFKQE